MVSRLPSFALLLLGLCLTSAAADYPEWVRNAPTPADPALLANANAVVLLYDTKIVYENDGYATLSHRYVVRLETNEGREQAVGNLHYDSKSDKVLGAEAWLIRDGKAVEHVSKGGWVDISAKEDFALIDEKRALWNFLNDKAVRGDIYAAETSVRMKVIYADGAFLLNPPISPVVKRMLSVSGPKGWTLKYKTVGLTASESGPPEGNSRHWEWSSIPGRPEEGHDGDELTGVIYTFQGTGNLLRTFDTWSDVGHYVESLHATQCDLVPDLKAKVVELTANLTSPQEKAKSLARYVQNTRYISIAKDLSLGRGFQPRKASEVFKTGYGDCKDKANLLRTMLREVGINSYPICAYIADGALVDESMPSPASFNHAILAIELEGVADLPTALPGENGKSLLVFDPTDHYTLFGDLPKALQGTLGCIAGDFGGRIITLPTVAPSKGFRTERELAVRVFAGGGVGAAAKVRAAGQRATWYRVQNEAFGTDAELEKAVKNQLGELLRPSKIIAKAFADDPVANVTTLTFTLAQPTFLQPLPGNRAVAKFDFFNKNSVPIFTEKVRKGAIWLAPSFVEDKVSVEIPDGFEYEEVPKGARLDSPYGHYTLEVQKDGQTLNLHRTFEVSKITAPSEDYAKVKAFFTSVNKADRCAAILKATPAPAPQK